MHYPGQLNPEAWDPETSLGCVGDFFEEVLYAIAWRYELFTKVAQVGDLLQFIELFLKSTRTSYSAVYPGWRNPRLIYGQIRCGPVVSLKAVQLFCNKVTSALFITWLWVISFQISTTFTLLMHDVPHQTNARIAKYADQNQLPFFDDFKPGS